MENALSQRFDSKGLLKFVVPSVIMMVFVSLYSMMGSVLAGQYINEYALSAINIVFPFVSLALAVAIMFATGANAIISANLGTGEVQKARENLSMITVVAAIIAIVFTVVGLCFAEQIITLLGGTENIMPYAKTYLKVLVLFFPMLFLDILSQYFFVTEGKAFMGMMVIVVSGVLSVALNFLLVAVFKVEIIGTALAMGIDYTIPAITYLYFFFRKKNRTLYFVKPKMHKRFILNTCTNGSSEMVTNLALSVVSAVMNIIMGNMMGDNGIAAVSVIIQVQFVLNSMYIGFGAGVAPIFGYAYGADDREQTKNVMKISLKAVAISSVILVLLFVFLNDFVVGAFLGADSEAFSLAKTGFTIFSLGYFFAGTNIFASVFFTSVSNGKISALISFLRTFLFILGMLAILPTLLETTGVWLSIPIAETMGVCVSILLLKKYREVYHY